MNSHDAVDAARVADYLESSINRAFLRGVAEGFGISVGYTDDRLIGILRDAFDLYLERKEK